MNDVVDIKGLFGYLGVIICKCCLVKIFSIKWVFGGYL